MSEKYQSGISRREFLMSAAAATVSPYTALANISSRDRGSNPPVLNFQQNGGVPVPPSVYTIGDVYKAYDLAHQNAKERYKELRNSETPSSLTETFNFLATFDDLLLELRNLGFQVDIAKRTAKTSIGIDSRSALIKMLQQAFGIQGANLAEAFTDVRDSTFGLEKNIFQDEQLAQKVKALLDSSQRLKLDLPAWLFLTELLVKFEDYGLYIKDPNKRSQLIEAGKKLKDTTDEYDNSFSQFLKAKIRLSTPDKDGAERLVKPSLFGAQKVLRHEDAEIDRLIAYACRVYGISPTSQAGSFFKKHLSSLGKQEDLDKLMKTEQGLALLRGPQVKEGGQTEEGSIKNTILEIHRLRHKKARLVIGKDDSVACMKQYGLRKKLMNDQNFSDAIVAETMVQGARLLSQKEKVLKGLALKHNLSIDKPWNYSRLLDLEEQSRKVNIDGEEMALSDLRFDEDSIWAGIKSHMTASTGRKIEILTEQSQDLISDEKTLLSAKGVDRLVRVIDPETDQVIGYVCVDAFDRPGDKTEGTWARRYRDVKPVIAYASAGLRKDKAGNIAELNLGELEDVVHEVCGHPEQLLSAHDSKFSLLRNIGSRDSSESMAHLKEAFTYHESFLRPILEKKYPNINKGAIDKAIKEIQEQVKPSGFLAQEMIWRSFGALLDKNFHLTSPKDLAKEGGFEAVYNKTRKEAVEILQSQLDFTGGEAEAMIARSAPLALEVFNYILKYDEYYMMAFDGYCLARLLEFAKLQSLGTDRDLGPAEFAAIYRGTEGPYHLPEVCTLLGLGHIAGAITDSWESQGVPYPS